MFTKRRLQALLLLLTVVLVLCSCGSSNKDSASNYATKSSADSLSYSKESESDGASTDSAVKYSVADQMAMESGEGSPTAGGSGLENPQVPEQPGMMVYSSEDGLNKKLMYRANFVMRVKDYSLAQSEVRNFVALSGGYLVGFSEDQSRDELGGNFVVKVPASGFSSFLNNLEQIKHESLQQNMQGEDVSEEYVDLESRLKAKELMEAQYINFMEKATKASDLVAFANALGNIQGEIEQMKGRMRYIDNNVAYSTVEIRLYQQEGKVDVFEEEPAPLIQRAKEAMSGTLDVLNTLFQWFIVFLFGAFPVIIILAIIGFIVWLVLRRRVTRPEITPVDRESVADEEKQEDK